MSNHLRNLLLEGLLLRTGRSLGGHSGHSAERHHRPGQLLVLATAGQASAPRRDRLDHIAHSISADQRRGGQRIRPTQVRCAQRRHRVPATVVRMYVGPYATPGQSDNCVSSVDGQCTRASSSHKAFGQYGSASRTGWDVGAFIIHMNACDLTQLLQ